MVSSISYLSRAAVLNLLLQFPHFGHYQTISSPLPQPNIP